VSAIAEHSIVKLSETISGWPAGTLGTVVSHRGETVLVEIAGEAGKALGFVQAPVSKLTFKR
jgi:hypothetical protein